MSCQKKIAEKITDAGADYTIGLQQNQPVLYNDCKEYFEVFSSGLLNKVTHEKRTWQDRKEGILPSYRCFVAGTKKWVVWIEGIGMVKFTITEKEKTHEFTKYFIISLTDINEFAYPVRKHWSIKNQLHWCLDVIFREDASRARKDKFLLNLNILRKIVLNFVSQAQYGRISKKKLIFKAALEPELFLKILFSSKK